MVSSIYDIPVLALCESNIDVVSASHWSEVVHYLMQSRYARARRPQLVAFFPGGPGFADCVIDGKGGSALLTELQQTLGADVLIHRNLFKTFVLQSAHVLGWPLSRLPSGSVNLGVRPQCLEPPEVKVVNDAVYRLCLPLDILCNTLLPLLGESWWGCCELAKASRTATRFTAIVPPPKRVMRAILPFQCTLVSFSFDHQVEGEWHSDSFVSLRTHHIWSFVKLLRFMRRKEHCSAEVMHIGGLGDVLV